MARIEYLWGLYGGFNGFFIGKTAQ